MKQNIQILSYQDFTKEEIKKIKKRMSIPFIKEYINYINARNKYNDKPHAVQELKQKVIDYAKYANVDPEDNKKIRNKLNNKIVENIINEDQDRVDNSEDAKFVIGGGCNSTVAKITKGFVGNGVLKTKHSKKNIITTLNNNKVEKFPYDTDVITTSAILSLIERQPKYYSKNTMSFVNANSIEDEDVLKKMSNIGSVKYNVRLFFMPITDESLKNSYYVGAVYNENKEIKSIDRLSRIDIENYFDSPYKGFCTSMLLPTFGNNGENIRCFSIDNKEKFSQELKKILCITPELIKQSVKQHLLNIGEKKDVIDKRVKESIVLYLDLLQSLNAVGNFFVKEYYNEIKEKDFSSKDVYKDNIDCLQKLKNDNNKVFFNYYKENLTPILKDKDLSKKIKTSINSFKNYLLNKRNEKLKKIRNRKVDYQKLFVERGWKI